MRIGDFRIVRVKVRLYHSNVSLVSDRIAEFDYEPPHSLLHHVLRQREEARVSGGSTWEWRHIDP